MDCVNNEDLDFALALRIQQEFDSQPSDPHCPSDRSGASSGASYSKSSEDTSTWSLVDPRWEVIDPIPDVRALFLEFNSKYFWGRLAGIEVRWSARMTLCAGLCVYEGRGGLCSVRLSEPLLKLRPRKDLIETLLHEMIHAYLFVTDNNRDHDGHGPEFHKHMYRLNEETGTNISVYHNFHDEVSNYRQHWWKCNGPCQKRPPYYGMVKRAMNRAPSPRDPWWPDHQRTCGGTYTKVKEPDGYKDKKEKKAEKEKAEEKKLLDKNKGNQDIRTLMGKGKSKDGENKPSSSKQVNKDASSSKSNETGVRDNVHGFGKEVTSTGSGKISNFQGNMHGFGNLSSQDSDDENNEKVKSIDNTGVVSGFFPGKGKSIGASQSGAVGENIPIVRKIPGIGLITTERLGSQNLQENSQLLDASSASNISGQNNKPNIINYDSEESDFDVKLDEILNKGAKDQKKNTSLTNKTTGFTSVSNIRRHSDPDRWKKLDKLPIHRSAGSGWQERSSSVKRKSTDNMAADRNKRACYISSSESGDDDENVTLVSSVKKQSTVMSLSPEESSSDSKSDAHDLSNSPRQPATSQSSSSSTDFIASGSPAASFLPNQLPSFGSPPPPSVANQVDEPRDCPVCCKKVPESKINDHLDLCLAGFA